MVDSCVYIISGNKIANEPAIPKIIRDCDKGRNCDVCLSQFTANIPPYLK